MLRLLASMLGSPAKSRELCRRDRAVVLLRLVMVERDKCRCERTTIKAQKLAIWASEIEDEFAPDLTRLGSGWLRRESRVSVSVSLLRRQRRQWTC